MFRSTTSYLSQSTPSANRIREKRAELAQGTSAPATPPVATAIVLGAAALALFAGYYFGPDLVRYLKIRRM